MRIGIIGAGFIGRALATLAVRNGHDAMISNSRSPITLTSTAAAIGCGLGTAEDAAKFGEVVVVSVPLFAYRALPVAALAGKIVIDTCNYYPQRDGAFPELDSNATTTSELLAAELRGARVVKAFNAILQRDLPGTGSPAGTPNRRALPIAGDDPQAKDVVAGLLDQFGFDVVDAGTLAESWRFERAMPAYCIPLNRAELAARLAGAKRGERVEEGSWRK